MIWREPRASTLALQTQPGGKQCCGSESGTISVFFNSKFNKNYRFQDLNNLNNFQSSGVDWVFFGLIKVKLGDKFALWKQARSNPGSDLVQIRKGRQSKIRIRKVISDPKHCGHEPPPQWLAQHIQLLITRTPWRPLPRWHIQIITGAGPTLATSSPPGALGRNSKGDLKINRNILRLLTFFYSSNFFCPRPCMYGGCLLDTRKTSINKNNYRYAMLYF